MKLLICTQKVDINDPILGFFHRWIEEIAKHCEKLTVICLEKGKYNLPKNIKVLSLGKNELGIMNYGLWIVKKIKYIYRFYKYVLQERRNYDAVFVHMNPEYCILGGIFWHLWRKKILLWYTHKAVNWRLRLGVMFASKVFTASKESFRLPSKKVEVVGHGIEMKEFSISNFKFQSYDCGIKIVTAGRIAPVKNYEVLIEAAAILKEKKMDFEIKIAGAPILKSDETYFEKLKNSIKEKKLEDKIIFVGPIDHQEITFFYQTGNIFINLSDTGSLDKAVLEAMVLGHIVITSSEAYVDLAKNGLIYAFPANDYQELAKTIEEIWKTGIIIPNEKAIAFVRKNHNLDTLINKIIDYFNNL